MNPKEWVAIYCDRVPLPQRQREIIEAFLGFGLWSHGDPWERQFIRRMFIQYLIDVEREEFGSDLHPIPAWEPEPPEPQAI